MLVALATGPGAASAQVQVPRSVKVKVPRSVEDIEGAVRDQVEDQVSGQQGEGGSQTAPGEGSRRDLEVGDGGSADDGGTSAAGVGDRDCSSFTSQQDAQDYFESRGGSSSNNVDNLDADRDGIACERLAAPIGGIQSGYGGTARAPDGPWLEVLLGTGLGLLAGLGLIAGPAAARRAGRVG